MRNRRLAALALLASLLATGCRTEDYLRIDGVTPGAGNAMYSNTVMQMVDPWPAGVQNTRLRVPADRGTEALATPSGGEAGKATPTTTNY